MSANSGLTSLVPTIYEALDIVSREAVGFIPAVNREVKAERVAVNQVIMSPVTPALASENIAPSNVSPNTAGITMGNAQITITKSKAVPWNFTGEETLGMQNSPVIAPYGTTERDLIAQAIRTLTNEVEVDLAVLARSASRAFGTGGTAPFATAADMSDFSQTLKILQDNGTPMSDLRMVLNTTHSANLRGKQSQLFRVNEANTDDLLRRGYIGDLMGFKIGESAGFASFTKGTAAGSTTTGAGFAVGTTSIALASAGTGTLLAGDVISFASDPTNKYVVVTGDADVSNGGTIVIQSPGLRVALPAATQAITVQNSYTPSSAFHKGAIQLAARLPALPKGGDSATEREIITDPVSGLNFEFAVYRQYRQVRWEVSLAWGVAVIAPRHLAMLLG